MKADGIVRSTRSRTIGGDGALVGGIFSDTFPGIELDSTDYLLVRSTQSLQYFEPLKLGSADIASRRGQDMAAGGTTLHSPQYATGGF